MKDIVKKILYPNRFIGFLIFNIAFGLLIYVFSCHLEETVIAYISYPLSFYALLIFCFWFFKVCKQGNTFIKEKSVTYKMYNKHQKKIIKLSMIFSLIINLLYGVLKLGYGIYYKSVWFITFAIYYLLLCFMKLSLILNVKRNEFGTNLSKEFKKLKHTGIILLLLDIILIGIIVLIITQDQIISYPGYLIYIVAMYDFYLIISAFINVFKYKNKKSPILAASKCINLTVAMISMISLEVAMIYQFGNNDSNFKLIMTSCTGFGVCLINSFMAIYMIVKSSKHQLN